MNLRIAGHQHLDMMDRIGHLSEIVLFLVLELIIPNWYSILLESFTVFMEETASL